MEITFVGGTFVNKTAACIKIIQILGARNDYVSSNELSEILEINPRNIKEYIKELQIAGYSFDNKKGIYGGYKLKNSGVIPSIRLDDNDKRNIQSGVDFLKNATDFLGFNDYLKSVGKLLASIERKEEVMPLTMIDRFPLSMDKGELSKRYQCLNEAVEQQLKCEITYKSQNNTLRVHTIHTYKLYIYNGAWFVLAFNESINSFGYFKLNRIEDIIKTRNRFTILKSFNEADYLDQFGMKQNGEYYHITLRLHRLNTAMNERVYGKNQQIKEIDKDNIEFSCDMQNKEMIKSFVLSFGSKCRVIGPEWLKEDIKNEYWKCLGLYEDEE